MNNIFNVIWHYATQSWVVTSELTKARGKTAVRQGPSVNINSVRHTTFSFTLAASVVLIATGQVAYGAEVNGLVGQNAIALGKHGCFYDTVSQSVVCGDGTTRSTAQGGIALGSGAVADKNAIAQGFKAEALKDNAIALGREALAKENQAIAIGLRAKAENTNAIAIGLDSSVTEVNSVAIGQLAKATGQNTTAIGNDSSAVGKSAVAIGDGAGIERSGTGVTYHSANNSTAVGSYSKAGGEGSSALGVSANASTENAVAVGIRSTASGKSSVAIGADAFSNDIETIAIGNKANTNSSQYGIAIGSEARLGGDEKNTAIAIGRKAQAINLDSNAIGREAVAKGQSSIAFGANANTGEQASASIAVGQSASTKETDGIAIGNNTKTGIGQNNTAIGSYADANVGWSTAIGTRAYTNANGALAAGTMSSAEGQRATAIGSYSFAEGLTSTALGYHTVATSKASAGTALGTGAVIDGSLSGAWGAVTHANPNQFDNTKRSIIGGTGNYAIGNQNVVGNQTTNSVIFGNNIKVGAESATLTTQNPAGAGNSIASRTETVTYTGATAIANAVAIGNSSGVSKNQGVAIGHEASAKAENGVALGAKSVADVAQGKIGADPLSAQADKTGSIWKATHSAVSVGNGTTITRQITSVAAGTKDTDAVNVAQLKAAGFKLATTNTGGGEVDTFTDDKIQNGETLTVDAGKNIKLTHTEGKVSIATKDDVDFNAVVSNDLTLNDNGSLVLGNDVTVDMGDNVISGVGDGAISANSSDAINGSQLFAQGEGVKNIIGGDTTYDPATGTYTNTDIGGTGKNNINDAIKASKTTVSSNDSSIKVTKTTDKDTGADNYDVSVNAQSLAETAQLPVVYTDGTGNKVYKRGNKFYDDPTAGTEIDPADVIASMQSADGSLSKPVHLTNVNAGSQDTDAVNVSQLKPFAQALGTTINADGSIKAPEFVVTKTDGDTYAPVTTIQGALDNIGTELQKPLSFAGDSGATITRKLGTEVNVKGGATSALTDNNIGVVSDGKDTLTVKLAEKINLGDKGSVTTGATTVNNAGVTITNTDPAKNVSLTGNGLNNGGNKIVNVANGAVTANSQDAINGSQLRNTAGDIATIIGGNATVDDKGNVTASDIGGTGEGNINDAIQAVNSKAGVKTVVTAGDGVNVENTGSTEEPNYKVSAKTDSVTTHIDTNGNIAVITGDMTVANDGKVNAQMPNSLATAGDIANAINNSGFNLQANGDAKSLVKAGDTVQFLDGDNIEITRSGNDITINTKRDVDFDSVSVGDGAVNIDASGIDMGDNKITNLAEGKDDTDAVNVSQLNKAAAAAKTEVTGSGLANVTSKAGDKGQTIYNVDVAKANAPTVTRGSVTVADEDKDKVMTAGDVAKAITGSEKTSSVKAGSKAVTVTAGNEDANGNTEYTVDVNTDGTTITKDPTTGAIKANTTALTNTDGKVNTPAAPNALATANDIANAINNAGFILTTSASAGQVSGTSNEIINPGKAVTLDAGKNIAIVQEGNKVSIETTKDVSFDSVTSNNISVPTANGNTINISNNGIAMGNTKITGVADGDISPTSTDVVNGSQIFALTGGNNDTTIGNYTVKNPEDGTQTTYENVVLDATGQPALLTYNVQGQGEYLTNSVITAINRMNKEGIKFFHTNDGTGTQTTPAQRTNDQDSSASGKYATAIGYRAQAAGENAIAIGVKAQANAINTISIGNGNIVNGENSGAFGDPTTINAKNSYSVGNNNELAVGQSDVFALGNEIKETTSNSVFLGSKSGSFEQAGSTRATNGVHKKTANSNYTYRGENDANVAGVENAVGVVSVGNATETRQIQGVAAGVVSETSTDAINGSQLYYTNKAIGDVKNDINKLGDVVNKNNRQLRAGIAGANAAAGLPQVYLPGKSMVAASAGTFKGEGALAVGYSRASDNGKVILKLQGNANTRGEVGGSVGIGYQW